MLCCSNLCSKLRTKYYWRAALLWHRINEICVQLSVTAASPRFANRFVGHGLLKLTSIAHGELGSEGKSCQTDSILCSYHGRSHCSSDSALSNNCNTRVSEGMWRSVRGQRGPALHLKTALAVYCIDEIQTGFRKSCNAPYKKRLLNHLFSLKWWCRTGLQVQGRSIVLFTIYFTYWFILRHCTSLCLWILPWDTPLI